MGHTYRGGKSGCKMVTEFDSYSYDGVSAGIWVIHIEAVSYTHLRAHETMEYLVCRLLLAYGPQPSFDDMGW